MAAEMTLEERSDLILAFARVLYANGQSTDQTLAAATRLGDILGLRARILPRWGELQLHANDQDAQLISTVAVDPSRRKYGARCIRHTGNKGP